MDCFLGGSKQAIPLWRMLEAKAQGQEYASLITQAEEADLTEM